MKKLTDIRINDTKKAFDPFRVISNDEYCTNMNAILAYFQMTKGEVKKRFISSHSISI